MGVGVAVCFGPYQVGAQIPNPFKHIKGNCIVVAKTFGERKNNEQPTRPQTTIPSWQYDLAQGGECNNVSQNPSKPSTPFSLTNNNGSPSGLPSLGGEGSDISYGGSTP